MSVFASCRAFLNALVLGEIDVNKLDLWAVPIRTNFEPHSAATLPRFPRDLTPVQIETRWSAKTAKLMPVKRRKYVWRNDAEDDLTGLLIYDRRKKIPCLWLPVPSGCAHGATLTAIVSRALLRIY